MGRLTDEVDKEVSVMIDCLLLVSMVDRYFIDFDRDVRNSKYFKQYVKRILPLCAKTIEKEHGRACDLFNGISPEATHGYIVACDEIDAKMNEQICMANLERSSTILQTIIEMIDEKITTVHEVNTANYDTVCKVIRRFSPHIPMQSNQAIRFIIEEALRNRIFNNVND